jgi:hypothetical protein
MTRRLRILIFVVAMIFIAIIATTSFKAIAGPCDEVCPEENEPCCCEEKEGYYLISYTCACAEGELQWQECKYHPLV